MHTHLSRFSLSESVQRGIGHPADQGKPWDCRGKPSLESVALQYIQYELSAFQPRQEPTQCKARKPTAPSRRSG